jgi:acetyl-CoA acetyltransferase
LSTHPYANVAIAAGYNTRQARRLDGHDSYSVALEAALGVVEAAGISINEIDAVLGSHALNLIYDLGLGPARGALGVDKGIPTIMDAANAIAAGAYKTVLIVDGSAGRYTERNATAPWTRPSNEFVVSYGLYTSVEFALVAQRYMQVHGTRPEQLAEVAATIRNNGHVNPEAVYYGRGPFTVDDILASRLVCEPFHLLDCAMTSEGGAALLLTTVERAQDLALQPAYLLGGAADHFGPSYTQPPAWDLKTRVSGDDVPNGYVGRRAARKAFATAGLGPADVDCCEFYDPFSFEIIRQFEAFEFCKDGEGADFVLDGRIGPDGEFPVTTDGGLMSFSHAGAMVQQFQRVIRGVHQVQGICPTHQVEGAQVAMCTMGGSGALFNEVILLGKERP